MPSEPVIVPPTPTITQNADVMATVQAAFDKALPEIKGTPRSADPPKPAQPPQAPKQEVKPPAEPAKPVEKPLETPPQKPAEESHKVPSFIEESLKVEPTKTQAPSEDEWPEELPDLKTPDERKSRYSKWRSSYQKLKEENAQLKSRGNGADEATLARVQQLESTNKEQATILSRLGLEQHEEFQKNVVRPMQSVWNEACRVVKDAGGDPNELARAVSLTGKAQFEALDSVMEGMPQSARDEVNAAIRQYKHLDNIRRTTLSNAPRVFEELVKKDRAAQYRVLEQQRKEMGDLFDGAVQKLRDAKVELFMTGKGEEAKDWNEKVEARISKARSLYLENTDMEKMAMATLLAPAADDWRKMWLAERAAHAETKKMLDGKFGSEPSLSESGGNHSMAPDLKAKEDLKKPFSAVFLEELKRQTAGSR